MGSPHATNNFDMLRFGAASLVILAHSVMIAGAETSFGPFAKYVAQLGGAGVGIFFIISGYLITASWERAPQAWRFLRNRILRIFPALVLCVCVSVFALGPLLGMLPARDYFAAPLTYTYLLNAGLYTGFGGLPGLFLDHPCPALVNGSLWTLPVEFGLYLVVLAGGYIRILNRKTVLIAFGSFVAASAFHVAENHAAFQGSIPLERAVKFAAYFFAGAGLYFYRSLVPMRVTIFGFAAAFFVLSAMGIVAAFIQFFTLPYLVIYVAHAPFLKGWNFAKYGDFSYGMYLYGFVVEQALEPVFRGAPWTVFFAVSYGASVLCGVGSWHLVEKRALRLKR